MKTILKFIFSFLIGAFMLNKSVAQSKFTLSGEYRLNPVYSHGFRIPLHEGDKAEGYVNQRTRLILNYEKDADLATELIIQDLRSWGSYKANGQAGNLSIFRAWAEKYFGDHWSLKLGRQGFIYDDEFILGELNWGGNMAHDAALLKYRNNNFQAHAAFAYNTNGFDLSREPYEYKNHKNMEFLWMHNDFDKVDASVIFLNRGLEKPDNSLIVRYEQTAGATVNFDVNEMLSLKGVYYYQFGKDTVGTGRDISAYLYSLQAQIKAGPKLTLTLGTDVASGADMDKEADPEYMKKNNFDILYGLRHGHFGSLDYFYVKLWPVTGVEDYYLKSKVVFSKAVNLNADWHTFMSNGKIVDPLEPAKTHDDYYGSEIDLKLNYKYSPTFKVSLGYSKMWTTESYDVYYNNQETEGSSFVYGIITINPTFFTANFE